MSLPRYPTLTILAFAGLMLLTDVVPALNSYKVMDWNTVPGVLHFVDRQPSATASMKASPSALQKKALKRLPAASTKPSAGSALTVPMRIGWET